MTRRTLLLLVLLAGCCVGWTTASRTRTITFGPGFAPMQRGGVIQVPVIDPTVAPRDNLNGEWLKTNWVANGVDATLAVTWTDSSGKGNDLTQATQTKQPKISADGLYRQGSTTKMMATNVATYPTSLAFKIKLASHAETWTIGLTHVTQDVPFSMCRDTPDATDKQCIRKLAGGKVAVATYTADEGTAPVYVFNMVSTTTVEVWKDGTKIGVNTSALGFYITSWTGIYSTIFNCGPDWGDAYASYHTIIGIREYGRKLTDTECQNAASWTWSL